jgi:hypothetical protein
MGKEARVCVSVCARNNSCVGGGRARAANQTRSPCRHASPSPRRPVRPPQRSGMEGANFPISAMSAGADDGWGDGSMGHGIRSCPVRTAAAIRVSNEERRPRNEPVADRGACLYRRRAFFSASGVRRWRWWRAIAGYSTFERTDAVDDSRRLWTTVPTLDSNLFRVYGRRRHRFWELVDGGRSAGWERRNYHR